MGSYEGGKAVTLKNASGPFWAELLLYCDLLLAHISFSGILWVNLPSGATDIPSQIFLVQWIDLFYLLVFIPVLSRLLA